MSISGRFVVQSAIGLLAVGLVSLLAIVAMTTWLGERAQIYFNDVIEARDTRGAAVELRNALLAAESSQRGYIVTGNEIYLAPFDSAKAQAQTQLDKLTRSLAPYPDTGPMLKRLTTIFSDK
ncbi:MAG: CHASE3 domain-containing protein, partial [Pseudolabrys sp.]|nr:CHASE3 domain-containing protein [Pseudolabrys sp.]